LGYSYHGWEYQQATQYCQQQLQFQVATTVTTTTPPKYHEISTKMTKEPPKPTDPVEKVMRISPKVTRDLTN
jgi:hypothetical protein